MTNASPLSHSHAPALRALAERLGLPTVAQLARTPGASAIYRVTVHYHDRRAKDSVATLRKMGTGEIVIEAFFDRALNQKSLSHHVSRDQFDTFNAAILGTGFDRLDDQPDIPLYDVVDVWLVERAAGTFTHGILVAPKEAQDKHGQVVNAIRHGIPEMIRVIA
ncbi:MAG: hypothetical protein IAE89_16680 [Anaerolineae bacterium]|nr:hypothetical protein [Anaerolineae bacterium]